MQNRPGGPPPSVPELIRRQVQLRKYSTRTAEAYVMWVNRYLRFHEMQAPERLGPVDVKRFLSHLASERNVSASTQNQARAALQFLYRDVLQLGISWLEGVERAKRPHRLPVVMTRGEVRAVLAGLTGMSRLVSLLLYGSGLRVSEALGLRVKDLDFESRSVMIRDGKGGKDRLSVLPVVVIEPLRAHLQKVARLWRLDLRQHDFRLPLPQAFAVKSPAAERDFRWYWVFPSRRLFDDVSAGCVRRSHMHESVVQRAVVRAVKAAAINKRATCHTFRHSFATHLLEDGYDIRTIREADGSCGCGDDDDLHACVEPGRSWRAESSGWVRGGRWCSAARGGSGGARWSGSGSAGSGVRQRRHMWITRQVSRGLTGYATRDASATCCAASSCRGFGLSPNGIRGIACAG